MSKICRPITVDIQILVCRGKYQLTSGYLAQIEIEAILALNEHLATNYNNQNAVPNSQSYPLARVSHIYPTYHTWFLAFIVLFRLGVGDKLFFYVLYVTLTSKIYRGYISIRKV